MKRDTKAEALRTHLEGYRPRVEKLRESMPEVGYGQREMPDDEHAAWMDQQRAQNPMWYLALPTVRKGRQEFERYNRTRGRGY